MYYRVIHVNTEAGLDEEVWVVQLPASIGRGSDVDVSLGDESVSRVHCQLFLNGEGSLSVRDLGSKNGTYVNDFRVHHSRLLPGDLLQLGSVTLRVEYASDTDHGKSKANRSPLKKQVATVTQPVPLVPYTTKPAKRPWWRFW